jgi:DNA replication and repair protein RecF
VFLKTLSLRQFRNHDRLDVDLSSGLNLFVGPNGAGKSNILEAVSLAARGESHRGADGKQLFPFDKTELAVVANFDGEEPLLVDVRQQRGRPRQVRLNNALVKRRAEWTGRVPLVSFCPEDLALVKGDPAVRRRALNEVLGQTEPSYAEALVRYQKILEERNACLKAVAEGRTSRAALEPWDLSLLKEGAALTLARATFILRFTGAVNDRHGSLTSHQETVALAYKPSFLIPMGWDVSSSSAAEVVAANRRRLQDLRDGETALGSTLIGPHRDDVEFFLDTRPAKGVASQGQQRTLTLAWKLAERDHLHKSTGRQSICLLDDLLSELDPARRAAVVSLLAEGGQTLVAATSLADWGGPLPQDAALFDLGRPFSPKPSSVILP